MRSGHEQPFDRSIGQVSVPSIPFVMRGISRIEDKEYRAHAWRVSLQRRGIMHVEVASSGREPPLTF